MQRSSSPATVTRPAAPFGGARPSSGAVVAIALMLLFGGCRDRIDTTYGSASGFGESSVNGTRVLFDMFSDRGHRVEIWEQLSPRLLKADVIVWFPDDFEPPSSDVRSWLYDWLLAAPDRTLIYVGRDFDAAPVYWKNLAGRVDAADKQAVATNEREAAAEFTADRKSIPDESEN